ncbi:gap junction delta-3 protein-like [Pungitius pungitius]|uniref:gap junction delta-3 protein-like n=1 Tax=Pungitius pungitius TaxID=134920 RepID=UPI002E0D27E6
MGEWGFLSDLFDSLQADSTMLGRFWLLVTLIFRMLILGTVAGDLFEDEQEEFTCNTLQPGCKQVCYDMAFPISQYRFWVFNIVLIASPALVFLVYVLHQRKKRSDGAPGGRRDAEAESRLRKFYLVNVAFRILAEVGFLVFQWSLYGFTVEAHFPCDRFPCPHTVDCFTSRPAEKTVFLRFYFGVGVISAASSCAELFYSSLKWFCCSRRRAYDPARSRRRRRSAADEEQGGGGGAEEEEEKPPGSAGKVSAARPKGGARAGRSLAASKVRKGGRYVSAGRAASK